MTGDVKGNAFSMRLSAFAQREIENLVITSTCDKLAGFANRQSLQHSSENEQTTDVITSFEERTKITREYYDGNEDSDNPLIREPLIQRSSKHCILMTGDVKGNAFSMRLSAFAQREIENLVITSTCDKLAGFANRQSLQHSSENEQTTDVITSFEERTKITHIGVTSREFEFTWKQRGKKRRGMDCVRKAHNQFSPFHLTDLKKERRQAEEMIAKNKPSIFENNDDDDVGNPGFRILNSSRKKDLNNISEKRCNTRTCDKKMTPSKVDNPRQNTVAIERIESSRKEKTDKIEEMRCKSGPLKTQEKEDHTRLTSNTRGNFKVRDEDAESPAKRRKLYDNATGLLKEVEETLEQLREERRTGNIEMRTKEETEAEIVQENLHETSGTPILNSPEKISSGKAVRSTGRCNNVATEGRETSLGKIKDEDITITENEDPKKNVDEQIETIEGKSVDDIYTDMLVVRNPTELAEVTDPFELQRMGYEFIVAAAARLQEEKCTAHGEIKIHLSMIDKLKSDLKIEQERTLMQNDIYDQQIRRLKELNENLEERSKIQAESLEKLEQRIKEMNQENVRREERASELKGNLENKIHILLEENEKLTNDAIAANDLIKAQRVKICAIPGAVQFFLRKFLEEGVWSKVKEERKNSTDGESEKQGDENEVEAGNIFDKISA